ncbi:MAG TPA: hypothetical protein VL651_12515 [Bacteroidia bacterium]|nr:hypothetical protein [Bacteroidia bacterium]
MVKVVWRSLWYLPLMFCISFWTFFLRATIALGRFPVYDQPDPKELGFDFHHLVTWWLLLGIEISFPICCISILVRIFWKRMPFYWIDLLFFIGGIALFLLTMISAAMEWFMD